jgi:uncharacterized protein (TIGR02145 family)
LGGITSVSISGVTPNTPVKTATIAINTTTDNPTGYKTTLSTNHSANTCLLRSTDTDCSTATSKINPVTGTVTSPSTLNANQWGATLATTFTNSDKGDDSVWFQIPNQDSSVIINNTAIPTVATGDNQDLTLGVKVNYDLLAGNYSNTVIITATANSYSATPTITNINPNSGEPSGNESITITGTNLGYAYQVFIDLNKDGEQDSGEECTDANIDNDSQITCKTPAATAGTYDVVIKTWGGGTKPATSPAGNTATTTDDYTYIHTPTSMQTMTTAYCDYASTNSTLALPDTRDNHYYYVGKMADGNCWMLTNLAYGGSEAGTEFTGGKGQTTTTNQLASATNWNRTSPPYNNQKQWVNPANTGVTQGSGYTRCATAYRTSASALDYTECGYLYNWCAALGSASDFCSSTQHPDIAGEILCPTGWRLPTGGTGEFPTLHIAMGSKYDNWLPSGVWRGVYSGIFYPGNGLTNQGSHGYYWSSIAYTADSAYVLSFSSGSASATGWMIRAYGLAVRCIFGS